MTSIPTIDGRPPRCPGTAQPTGMGLLKEAKYDDYLHFDEDS